MHVCAKSGLHFLHITILVPNAIKALSPSLYAMVMCLSRAGFRIYFCLDLGVTEVSKIDSTWDKNDSKST